MYLYTDGTKQSWALAVFFKFFTNELFAFFALLLIRLGGGGRPLK